ncbi:MAG TPA: lysine--tRNA ligase [Mycobacteriales bacterium]|nr:lysine--tRNA ligase [Mycobacteriales bacterium]
MAEQEPRSEQELIRRAKLDRLQSSGVEGYPVKVRRTTTNAKLRAEHPDLAPDTATGEQVSIAGRVVLKRDGGKLCFATLRDGTGDLQVMLSLDRLGEARLEDWKRDVDLGDHVSIDGEVVSSRRGELSVMAGEWTMASKALRPLPEKWAGISDEQERVRRRYVDLVVNPDARRIVEARAALLRSLRSTLDSRGYVEVETPILQTLHGGAAARPFETHLNAFDLPMYLRIALELWLKRLVVGGVERVYEIGRIFRNEGVDTTHSPEFTMLEAYEAYGDYGTMAELTRALVVNAARDLGSTVVAASDGTEIDLAQPWRTVTVFGAISEALGTEVTIDTGKDKLVRLAAARDIALRPDWDAGEIVLELYEQLVEGELVQPTFVRDYPASVRPLARPHRDDPRLAEAWDLVVNGIELAPAYSELVDPVEQRRRLTEQSAKAAGGNAEAMQLDEDFLRALEHGAPPMGGMGLGVDRLLMLLTGVNIREAITFPLLRPEY